MAQYIWTCSVCKHTFIGEEPPVPCPICKAGRDAFTKGEEVEQEKTAIKEFRCVVCGVEFEGDTPPETCPVCGANVFEEVKSDTPAGNKNNTTQRFVIIGAGAAATQAAKTIREKDSAASITIVSKEKRLPYNRPALSDIVGGKRDFDSAVLQNDSYYQKQNISVLFDTAVSIDRATRKVTLENGTLDYDKLLIATGANPFQPVAAKEGAIPVFSLRSAQDAQDIINQVGKSKNAAVLGGGILGIEAIIALHNRGLACTVIERSDRILSIQGDAEVSVRLQEALEQAEITVVKKGNFASLTDKSVILEDGREIAADFLLVCAGVRSEIALAKECGLTVEKGIVADRYMKTSDENVFAAGDCAQVTEGGVGGLWSAAVMQGKTAGLSMLGQALEYKPIVPATALSFSKLDIFTAGTVSAPDLTSAEERTDNGYKCLYFKNDKLCGIVLINEPAASARAIAALEKGADRTAAMELLK